VSKSYQKIFVIFFAKNFDKRQVLGFYVNPKQSVFMLRGKSETERHDKEVNAERYK